MKLERILHESDIAPNHGRQRPSRSHTHWGKRQAAEGATAIEPPLLDPQAMPPSFSLEPSDTERTVGHEGVTPRRATLPVLPAHEHITATFPPHGTRREEVLRVEELLPLDEHTRVFRVTLRTASGRRRTEYQILHLPTTNPLHPPSHPESTP